MDLQQLDTTIKALTAKREEARKVAQAHASTEQIEKLTAAAVGLINRGKDASELLASRDRLKDVRDANVRAIGEELSQARKEAKELASQQAAQVLEDQDIEALVAMQAKLTQDRKLLKARMRAVSVAIAKKRARITMAELWANLSPEERKALLASVDKK